MATYREADRIASLPGWHGALPSAMYSGFLNSTLDAKFGQLHSHYWLVLSERVQNAARDIRRTADNSIADLSRLHHPRLDELTFASIAKFTNRILKLLLIGRVPPIKLIIMLGENRRC